MKGVKRGTFVSVIEAPNRKGKVEKMFNFPLTENAVKRLEKDHESYVSHLRSTIALPETVFERQKLNDGRYQVSIFQDDMDGDGMLLADFLSLEPDISECMGVFSKALKATMQVREYSAAFARVDLGLESNPHNWWIRKNGDAVFFDTVPPIIAVDNNVHTDMLVMRDNPTFLGRLMSCLAHGPLGFLRKLSEKVMRKYAFDWPTTVRTFLVKAIDCAPGLKNDLVETARDVVGGIRMEDYEKKRFMRKLSDFSVNIELAKLKFYNFLDSI